MRCLAQVRASSGFQWLWDLRLLRSEASQLPPAPGPSMKACEIAEEKEAVEQYRSSDPGFSLGDIPAAALKKED